VGPRAGLNERNISSPPGIDPGPSSPWSVAIPTEPPGPLNKYYNATLQQELLKLSESRPLTVNKEGKNIS